MGMIQWEIRAESSACHPPHIILFNKNFIVVHHMETGCLVQVISRDHVRCTWDGQGINQPQNISEGSGGDVIQQEPCIHGVMQQLDIQPYGRLVGTESVFELIPKVL